jgi:beta-lactamase superfamily II metal-dependent hydrolase
MKITLLLLLSLITLAPNFSFLTHAHDYTLKFIDIGQGDAVIIRTPTNCTMVVDGGPLNNLTDQIHKHLPATENKIDLMVLSHPHLDHMGGLIQLLNRYKVEHLFTTGVMYESSFYTEFINRTKNTKVTYPKTNQTYNLCGIEIKVIYPIESLIGQTLKNVNDASIVLQLKIKDTKIYLSGDAEHEAEEEILGLNINLDADIMKAGHHGSRTSNSIEILNKVSPDYLIIQSGKGNSYNHPHYETIDKANQINAKVLRNDVEGTITFFF